MVYKNFLFISCVVLSFACTKEKINRSDKLAPTISVETNYTPFQELKSGTDSITPAFIISDNIAVRGYKFTVTSFIASSINNTNLPFTQVQNSNASTVYFQATLNSSFVGLSGVYQTGLEAFDAVGLNTTFKQKPIYISTGSAPIINVLDVDGRIENDTLTLYNVDSLNFEGSITDTDTILKATIYSYIDSLKTVSNLYSKNLATTFASADSLFKFKWESFPSFSGFVIIVEDKLGNINAQYIPIKKK